MESESVKSGFVVCDSAIRSDSTRSPLKSGVDENSLRFARSVSPFRTTYHPRIDVPFTERSKQGKEILMKNGFFIATLKNKPPPKINQNRGGRRWWKKGKKSRGSCRFSPFIFPASLSFPPNGQFHENWSFFVVFFHYYYIAFVSRYNIAECLLRFLYVSNDPPCYFRRRRRLPRVLTPVFNSSSRAVSTSSVTRAS